MFLQASEFGLHRTDFIEDFIVRTVPVEATRGEGSALARFAKNRRHSGVKEKHTCPKVVLALAQARVIRAGRITR